MIWLSLALAACEVLVVCDGTPVGSPVPLPALECDTASPEDTAPPADTGDTGVTALAPERIIVVLLDDIGIGALSTQTPYAHPAPPAPTLDALAATGRRFARAYAAPVCSPARARLLTGRAGTRDGAYDYAASIHHPAIERAWPIAFRDAGWSTRYVGKWHLSGVRGNPGVPVLLPGGRPTEAGFQTWNSNEGEANDGLFLVSDEAGSIVELSGESSDVYLQDGLSWTTAQPGPSLLMVALSNAHTPYVAAPADWLGLEYVSGEAVGYWAEVRAADRALGDFVAGLDAAGLLDSTLLVVVSDNGTKDNAGFSGYPNGDAAGFKTQIREGGLRVPLIIHWPDGGLSGVETRPIGLTDLGHTLASIAGVPWTPLLPTDGEDASALLSGDPHLRTSGMGWTFRGDRAWLSDDGAWKIEEESGVMVLRDLVSDPRGDVDVAAAHPAIVADLTAELDQWEASTLQSASCLDYPGADCGPARRNWWTNMNNYAPYVTDWCARPEFAAFAECP